MINVWHVYANRQNMGDWASMLGIRQCLYENLGENVHFSDAFFADHVGAADLERVRRSADLVVVGGGGAWCNKPATQSGWMWDIRTEDLRGLGRPLVFWGVGLNAEWRNEKDWELPPAAARSVAEAVRLTALTAVRDTWTATFLGQLGVENIEVIPCASVCLQPRAARRTAGPVIAVNVLPSTRLPASGAFLRVMTRFLRGLVEAGNEIIYVAHAPEAEDVLQALQSSVPGRLVVPSTPLDVVDAYAAADAAIVMRGHGVLLAMAAGTPAVTVAYNRKCWSFAEQSGMTAYVVDWRPGRLRSNADAFRERLDDALARLLPQLPAARIEIARRREAIRRANVEFARKTAEIALAATTLSERAGSPS